MANALKLLRFKNTDGQETVAKYGRLCSILNLQNPCNRCPIHALTFRDSSTSCSDYAIHNPEKFFKATGLRFLGFVQNTDACINANSQGLPTRESILDDARRCVCGDRDAQYGSPESNFEAIADLWKAYLVARGAIFPAGDALSAEDVAAMMVLFKMARVATGSYKADSWIDAAGYAACGGEIGGNKE